eukprot:4082175-Prymnesium_polylepis.1
MRRSASNAQGIASRVTALRGSKAPARTDDSEDNGDELAGAAPKKIVVRGRQDSDGTPDKGTAQLRWLKQMEQVAGWSGPTHSVRASLGASLGAQASALP